MQHLVGLAAMAAALLTAITADAIPSDSALEFENSGVVYEIPSEYLAQRDQSRQQPALEVTYPDFRPARTSGRGCGAWFVSAMRHTCATFQFLISGGQGATRRQMADNAAKLPSALRQSAVDQFGYETWWSKNNPSLVNFYRNGAGGVLYFFCTIDTGANGERDGICTDHVFMSDGNTAAVLFPYHLRNELPGVEAGIDRLMASFHRRQT